jgi:hypothetical protein
MNRILLSIFALLGTLSTVAQNQPISLQHLSTTHLTGGFASGAAEITSFNPGAKRLFVVNGSTDQIDVLDVANPISPEYLFSIDISSYGAGANSVVTFDNYVAIAVEAFVQQDPGTIVIADIDGNVITTLQAGALPDMIGISPDHTKLYTANEGQPADDYSIDPVGSITVVDLAVGVENVSQADVHQLYFDQFEFIRNSFEMQAFDNWSFTANPVAYAAAGEYVWGEVTDLNGRTALHGDTFWGIQDLNNAEQADWHSIEFETQSIEGRPRARMIIRYFYENFEETDSIGFTLVNGTEGSFGLENFVALPPVSEGWGEYVIELDPSLLNASIKLWVKCDDADDVAGFDDVKISFVDPSVRVTGQFGLSTLTQDMEPEYIAASADGSFVQVSLQENNAMGIIDLNLMAIVDVVGLGFKDYSLPGNGIDASNQDGGIHIQNWPVFGMYMPDAIASFTVNSETYFVSANEGDARAYGGYDEESRVSGLTLDPTAYPDASTLQQNANLGRLMTTLATGDRDGDGDVDQIYSYGARSFSIWNENAELVFDSGDQFEQITAQLDPAHFNSNNDDNTSFDSRSDDKGPEPEGVATGVIAGRTYAFVCLERIGGIMVYDVTNPEAPEFIEYFNNRNWTASDSDPASLDQGPEGILFISKENSPNERDLLVLSNEISGTVSIFQISVDRTVTGEIALETFDLQGADLIGVVNGIEVFEGGASGLMHIEGTENEFYFISDRGPNLDANNHPLAQGETKVFVFPDYAPKIQKITASEGVITIEETMTVNRPDATPVTGLPLPLGAGNSGEYALDALSNVLGTDNWGVDTEGLVQDAQGFFWACDEYGASVIKMDSLGTIVARYTPFPIETQDIQIDPMIGMRKPNRGFEGLTVTPNGRVWAMLQSPANNPDAATGNASRLHRVLELDPFTGTWNTYLYAHKPAIGEIRERDWKMGDMVAINNTEFLIIEHAERNGWNYKNIIKFDITGATPLTQEDFGGLTPEQLIDIETCLANGIQPIVGEVYLDLLEAGWDTNLDKPEGLTIIDANTIAVINDNDFGIASPDADGVMEETGKPTRLYIYGLPEDMTLNMFTETCAVDSIEASFCEGDFAIVEAPAGYVLYEWASGESTASIEVSAATEVDFRVTTETGCAAIGHASVAMLTLPQASIIGETAVCQNDSVYWSIEGMEEVMWNMEVSNDSLLIDGAMWSVGLNTIQATFIGENGCSNSIETDVEVYPLPTSTLAAEYAICAGENIMVSTENEVDAHVWSNGVTENAIEINEAGDYTVNMTTPNGCSVLAATTLVVNALPTVDLGENIAFCAGESAMLDAGEFTTVLWSNGLTEAMIEVNEPGTYSIEVTDAQGCVNTDMIDVVVNALPVVDLGADLEVCDGETVAVSATGFESVSWSTGESTETILVGTEGTVSVEVTDANGCTNTDEVFVDVIICIGVDENEPFAGTRIYPNPASDFVKIDAGAIELTSIMLVDATGKAVHTQQGLFTGVQELSVSELSAGLYQLVLLSAESSAVYNVIIP